MANGKEIKIIVLKLETEKDEASEGDSEKY
jgi:hypothetical protein